MKLLIFFKKILLKILRGTNTDYKKLNIIQLKNIKILKTRQFYTTYNTKISIVKLNNNKVKIVPLTEQITGQEELDGHLQFNLAAFKYTYVCI